MNSENYLEKYAKYSRKNIRMHEMRGGFNTYIVDFESKLDIAIKESVKQCPMYTGYIDNDTFVKMFDISLPVQDGKFLQFIKELGEIYVKKILESLTNPEDVKQQSKIDNYENILAYCSSFLIGLNLDEFTEYVERAWIKLFSPNTLKLLEELKQINIQISHYQESIEKYKIELKNIFHLDKIMSIQLEIMKNRNKYTRDQIENYNKISTDMRNIE